MDKVLIRSASTDEEYVVTIHDYHNAPVYKVGKKYVTYAEAGFDIVSYADGKAFAGGNVNRGIER